MYNIFYAKHSKTMCDNCRKALCFSYWNMPMPAKIKKIIS